MAVSLIIDVLSLIESDRIKTNMETGGIHSTGAYISHNDFLALSVEGNGA